MFRHLFTLTTVALLGTSIGFINSQIALAIPVEQLVGNSKLGVVRIDSPNSSGSGFLVKKEGNTYTVMTNRHVVEPEGEYKITTSDRKTHIATKITRYAEVDLAELQLVSEVNYKPLDLDGSASLYGQSLYLTGYPGEQRYDPVGSREFNYYELKHSGNPTNSPGGYNLSFVGAAFPGMSGSPIINSDGKVVAIFGRYQSGPVGDFGVAYGISSQVYLSKASLRTIPNIDKNKTPDANSFFAKGNSLYYTDKKGAIEAYNEAIKINPQYADAFRNRGVAKYELGDKQAAIQDYDQAIKINPQDADAYISRGLAKSELGDKQAAINDYDQAIKINPQDAAAYINRGNAKYVLGDKQAALSDYVEAARLYKLQNKDNDYRDALKRAAELRK